MEHITPTIEVFNEIKEASKVVWNTMDDTCGYVTEKLKIVDGITNYSDNIMIGYRMFDYQNQRLMKSLLSKKALLYIENNL